MDRALGDTGLNLSLQMAVVLSLAIIEEPIVHPNVSRTVGNHHRRCK